MAKTRERLETEAHKHPGVEQVDRSEIWQKAAESADTVVEEASSSSKEKTQTLADKYWKFVMESSLRLSRVHVTDNTSIILGRPVQVDNWVVQVDFPCIHGSKFILDFTDKKMTYLRMCCFYFQVFLWDSFVQVSR